MDALIGQLTDRKAFLQELIGHCEENIDRTLQGTLRISQHHGRCQYYHRLTKEDSRGKYIPKKQRETAAVLAQNEYEASVLRAAKAELSAIEHCLKRIPAARAEEVYPRLNRMRKELVIPAVETDEMFVDRWLSQPYVGLGFSEDTPDYFTRKGERVRSKSEIIIADVLEAAGIPYLYERPLRLSEFDVVYPDFTVLNVRRRKVLYWEHQGMMDDEAYVERAIRKEAQYISHGYYPGDDLILTSETLKNPINMKQVQSIVEHYLL